MLPPILAVLATLIALIAFLLDISRTGVNLSDPALVAALASFLGVGVSLLVYALIRVGATARMRRREQKIRQDIGQATGSDRSRFKEADLRDADLRSVDLSAPSANERFNLHASILANAVLRYADLRYVDLSASILVAADLREANLYGADLKGSNLMGADLSGANLQWANLQRAVLIGADLENATLTHANLKGADLISANLRDADLAHILEDDRTRWPRDFVPPKVQALLLHKLRSWQDGGDIFLTMGELEQFSQETNLSLSEIKNYLALLTSPKGPIIGQVIESDESGLIGLSIHRIVPDE